MSRLIHRAYLMRPPAVVIPAGQIAYTTAGDRTWTVPAGVTRVSIAMGGAGGGAALRRYAGGYNIGTGAGGAGGICWFTLKVQAGDVIRLTTAGPVECQSNVLGPVAADGQAGGQTNCYLNGNLVAAAFGGEGGKIAAAWAAGGHWAIYRYGDIDTSLPYGGNTGGRGGYGSSTNDGPNGGAGGAPGYDDGAAPGGDGAHGGHTGPTMGVISSASGGDANQGGGGVGIYGKGPRGTTPGAAGSGGQPAAGWASGGDFCAGCGDWGFHTAEYSGRGFARLIWGAGRHYPSTGVADV